MSSYAFGGEGLGEPPGSVGIEFARPTPLHALTPAAEAARAAVRAAGREKRALPLTGDVGRPHVVPWEGEIVKGARVLHDEAEALGYRVQFLVLVDRLVVEGIRGTVAFRAIWVRGRAHTGTWYERDYRYAIVQDDRPMGASKLTRTALAKHRPLGVGTTRLAQLGGPDGVSVGVSGVLERVRAS